MISDKLKEIFDDDDAGLLDMPKRQKPQTSSDRLEVSFLEIVDFYNEHDRMPSAETTDMAERKLGVRLKGILLDEEKIQALKHLDKHNLLKPEEAPESIEGVFKDDELGLLDDPTGILTLKNIPTNRAKSDYVAKQRPSKDFKKFEPLFIETQKLISSGHLTLKKITSEYEVEKKRFYILRGVLTYVADMEERKKANAKMNARLRLIYENGTESNIKARSFARALYRNGYVVVGKDENKTERINGEDIESGYIYILKSLSDNPKVANIRDLYKIGFSRKSVPERIKNAINDPTYLMAPVKIVATYKGYNLNPRKFENLIHRFFDEVKLDISLTAPDGAAYIPSEWYVVPLDVLDKVIDLIISGEITHYRYNPGLRDLVPRDL